MNANINYTMSWDEYFADPRMNASRLVYGCKSALHLKNAIDGKFDQDLEKNQKIRLGRQVHTLLLEPDEFEATHVVMPDFHLDPENRKAAVTKAQKADPTQCEQSTSKTTNYVKQRVADFQKEHADKSIIGESEYYDALMMVESIRAHPTAAHWFDQSRREVCLFGEIEGVPMKGRVDLWNDYALIDVKDTVNADKFAFARVWTRLRYAFRAAVYRELDRQNTGRQKDFYFIVQESEGDFDTCVVPMVTEIIDNAFDEVIRICRKYKKALKSNRWPGVDGGQDYYELHVPNWAMPEEEILNWSQADEG